MSYLLDTHTFLWMDSAPQRLSAQAAEICQAIVENLIIVSKDAQIAQYTVDVAWS